MAINWRQEADNIINTSELFANSDAITNITDILNDNIQSNDNEIEDSGKLFGLVFGQDTDGDDIKKFCMLVQEAFFPSNKITVDHQTFLSNTYLHLYFEGKLIPKEGQSRILAYKELSAAAGIERLTKNIKELEAQDRTSDNDIQLKAAKAFLFEAQIEIKLFNFMLSLIYNEKISLNGNISSMGIVLKPKQDPDSVSVFDSFTDGEISLSQLEIMNDLNGLDKPDEKAFITSRYAILHFLAEQAHAYFAGKQKASTGEELSFSTEPRRDNLMDILFYDKAHAHALKMTTNILGVEHLDGRVSPNKLKKEALIVVDGEKRVVHSMHLVEFVKAQNKYQYITTYKFSLKDVDGEYAPLREITKNDLWETGIFIDKATAQTQ